MAPLPRTSQSSSKTSAALVSALEGLSDGLYGMFSQRLELFRLELLQDAQRMGVWAVVLIIAGVVAALGYGMLNLAVVIGVGAMTSGKGMMAVTAAVLATFNLVVAAVVVRTSVRKLTDARVKMHVTLDEFRRDKKWLREIKEPSPEEASVTKSSTPT